MSPNNKAYVAVLAHFHQEGKLVALLLDIVEVVMSHSGKNLVCVFAEIMDAFGIEEKVSYSSKYKENGTHHVPALQSWGR